GADTATPPWACRRHPVLPGLTGEPHRFKAHKQERSRSMTPRTHRLAIAALAILTAAALAACGSDTTDPPPNPPPHPPPPPPTPHTTPPPPPPPPPPTPTPTQPTSRPATGPATKATTATPGSDFGFIHSWTAKAGTFSLRFDRAVLLTGKAADAASAAHGGESPAPNDYYIQNDNP